MTAYMYRQIFGVTIYMIVIMMVIMYCGKSIFELDYELSTQIIDDDDPLAKQKMKHFTLIWNTFIFLPKKSALTRGKDLSQFKTSDFF